MALALPDGTLRTWAEVKNAYDWQTLLLGNGMSINVWPRFGYSKLYEHAEHSALTEADRRLFADTPNFERVLGDLSGSGVTWKLRRTAIQRLLDQFGQPIPGDAQARPLLVTEGSARDKLRAIEANSYLTHALDRLGANPLPLVVFGSSLSAEDQHIADAISRSPGRPVAVSMLPGARAELLATQLEVHGRIAADDLIFFDATTHPLGDDRLRVPGA